MLGPQGFEYILEKHGGTARWGVGGTFSQKSRFGHLLPPKKERLGRSAWAFWNFDRFLIYHIIITIINYHYYCIIIIIVISIIIIIIIICIFLVTSNSEGLDFFGISEITWNHSR